MNLHGEHEHESFTCFRAMINGHNLTTYLAASKSIVGE